MPGEGNADGSMFSYDKACAYRKISSFAAAIMLVVVSIFSILSIGDAGSLRVIIMTIYFILIGLIIVGVEMERGSICQWFLFLNFGWGKVYLYMFLVVAMLSLPTTSWLQWIIGILFTISAGFNMYLSRKYADEEMQRIRKIVEDI